MRLHPFGAILFVLLSVVLPMNAQIALFVPSQFATIQAAVNAANSGDTILVSPGVYLENIDLGTKSLTIRATDGPGATVIDAQNIGRGIVMRSPSTIEGLTIQNGRAPNGQPTGGNYYGGDGGGIYIVEPVNAVSALPFVVRGCVVTGCRAGDGAVTTSLGGGFTLVFTPGNGGNGGGIYASTGSKVVIDRCVVSGNATGTGAITANFAAGLHGNGGGIFVFPTMTQTVEITECLIVGNSATASAPPPFFNGLDRDGGGIAVGFGFFIPQPVQIRNCTITGNNCGPGRAGGIVALGSTVNITASIVASNASLQIGVLNVPYSSQNSMPATVAQSPNPPTVTQCCVFPNGVPGATNLSVDPSFRSSTDFRLQSGSACIDAVLGATTTTTDLAGAPRLFGSAVDIGAYESVPRLAGTNEDFELRTTVDGVGHPLVGRKILPAGRTLLFGYTPTANAFVGAAAGLAIEVFATGQPPVVSQPIFPELWLDVPSTLLIDGPVFLPMSGVQLRNPIPPGLSGLTARLQAFALNPSAQNGILALSDAHDLIFQ